jgi:sensor histidine kinase YesM
LRKKLLISAVLVFLVFAVISALISYSVSVSLVRRDIVQYHQYELQVLMDQYQEQKNRIRERVAILTADKRLSDLVSDCIEAVAPYQIQQNLDNLEHYLYLLLYLNPELESIVLNLPGYVFTYDSNTGLIMESVTTAIVGTVPSEKIISLSVKNDIKLKAIQKDLFSFDLETYSLLLLNPSGEVVEWHRADSDSVDNSPDFLMKRGEKIIKSFIENGIVYSNQRDDDGYTFVLYSSISGIDSRLEHAGFAILLCLLITSLLYSVFCFLYSKHLIRPLNEMGDLFENMQSYTDRDSVRSYYLKYKNDVGLHPKVFRYYRTAMAPLLFIIAFSFFTFIDIVNFNQKQSEARLLSTFANSLQHSIESFELFTKFLSLSDTIQDVMVRESMGEYSSDDDRLFNEISGYLIREGIFSSGILSVNLYDSNGSEIYSSEFFSRAKGKIQLSTNDYISYRTHTLVSDEPGDSNTLRFISRINYMPEAVQRIKPMSHLGYIEVAVKNFIPEKLALIEGDNSIFFKLLRGDKSPTIMPEEYSGLIYTIKNTNLKFALGIAFSRQYSEKTQIILLDLILVLLQIILVLIISRYFENRILSPMSRLENFIKEQRKIQIPGFDSKSKDNEFIRLTDSFNTMMERLNRLSADMHDLEVKAHQSDLIALQAQIKPHFFNNIIASILLLLNNGKNEEAMKMLGSTARHFRGKIFGHQRFIPISEEIQHIRNYIEIQNYRFDDLITLQLETSLDLNDYLLPRLLLQPLIENSITHGMKESTPLTIKVRIDPHNGGIRIQVEDDGLGMAEEERLQLLARLSEPAETLHYGLANIRARLELLNQGIWYFDIQSEKDIFTRITLDLPLLGVMDV